MSRRSIRRIASAAAFVAFILCIVAQAQRSIPEGAKPYAPARLEWLAVDLNGRLHVALSESTGYSMEFVPLTAVDTLVIYVRYLPSVNREVMNISIDTARKIIALSAKSHGWSSWLKVKEDVEMARAENDK
jgi:hypothetical protein